MRLSEVNIFPNWNPILKRYENENLTNEQIEQIVFSEIEDDKKPVNYIMKKESKKYFSLEDITAFQMSKIIKHQNRFKKKTKKFQLYFRIMIPKQAG